MHYALPCVWNDIPLLLRRRDKVFHPPWQRPLTDSTWRRERPPRLQRGAGTRARSDEGERHRREAKRRLKLDEHGLTRAENGCFACLGTCPGHVLGCGVQSKPNAAVSRIARWYCRVATCERFAFVLDTRSYRQIWGEVVSMCAAYNRVWRKTKSGAYNVDCVQDIDQGSHVSSCELL